MRGENTQLIGVIRGFTGHKLDAVALCQAPVYYTHQHDHAYISVVPAVNDHGTQRAQGIPLGWRNLGNHGFENLVDAHAGLGAAGDGIGRINADHVLDFLLGVFRISLRQIHLVEYWHDGHAQVQRGVAVGNGLRLHALAGIHHQQRTFTGRQRAAYFV